MWSKIVVAAQQQRLKATEWHEAVLNTPEDLIILQRFQPAHTPGTDSEISDRIDCIIYSKLDCRSPKVLTARFVDVDKALYF